MNAVIPRGPLGRLALTIVVAGALSGLLVGSAIAKDKRQVDVMTQNLYLGSSLNSALEATSGEAFVGAVAGIYGTMLFTNFPARAQAIAAQIDADRPGVIGLQEVSKWIAAPAYNPAATPVSQDFEQILLDALDARGLNYSVVSTSNNADIGPAPLVAPAFGCGLPYSPTQPQCVVTLQDRDVILVNDDSDTVSAAGSATNGNYVAQQYFTIPDSGGVQISFNRGWAAVEGTVDGKKVKFVNTHLETEDSPLVQQAQGQEFLAGPAKGSGAVIATGDFNSAADGSTTTTYASLTQSYFNDAWDTNPGVAGLTCCQSSALANPVSALNSRIDLVLGHAAARPFAARVVNATPIAGVPPFWASDHAGVIGSLRVH